jgi:formylglycine-generating enzyme
MAPSATQVTGDMVQLEGGAFTMGSDHSYPEERPARRVTVEPFQIDRHPVTVREFRAFVAATGHVTLAERQPDPADYPGAAPGSVVPGSLVFRGSEGPVDLRDPRNWWAYVPGATWRHPEGPGSRIAGRHDHPVVHVGFDDAVAYADWAGKALPTEAEWEYAARGGLEGATYAWGDDPEPDGRPMANTWQGEFPWQNLERDGYRGTSPVGAFPPNGFGLFDATGNVWEWTADRWSDTVPGTCCGPHSTGERYERRIIKGGSHLCAPSYCLRYRPAARQTETLDTSTSHIGFRCVVRPGSDAPAPTPARGDGRGHDRGSRNGRRAGAHG